MAPPESRKQRRKEERESKRRNKKKPRLISNAGDEKNDDRPRVVPTKRLGVQSNGSKVSGTRSTASPAETNFHKNNSQSYRHLDPLVAAELRREDMEIQRLEEQLSIAGGKHKKNRLHREYATQEGFGDDFGDFLDSIDTMVEAVVNTTADDEEDYQPILDGGEGGESHDDDDDDESETSVPMKGPALSQSDSEDLDEPVSEDDEYLDNSNNRQIEEGEDDGSHDDDQDSIDPGADGEGVIYRPVRGEDIYGKSVDGVSKTNIPTKYVPPHLRNKGTSATSASTATSEHTLREIQRSLNSSLNRLSEETLISVTQSLVKTYDQYATTDVNQSMFRNLEAACVARGQTMEGLIPIYVASIAGVHFCNGDTVQLREYVMEHTVTHLMDALDNATQQEPDDVDVISREASNIALILCYLYNFGLVHCTLLYDVVRHCLDRFREVDVEILLLLLRHCGRALRTDDPLALKEIVLLVQKQQQSQHVSNHDNEAEKPVSSRADYMVQTILDLKNNKRRKQDENILERTARIRKMLGHIKSSQDKRASEPLRISLDDIRNIATKGRWWKVGASWAGNAAVPSTTNGLTASRAATTSASSAQEAAASSMNPKLLKLAAKYRMNTDIRRAIFCIIMGSEDYEDCFEKLVRAGMLKPRVERDTVRVLMECCKNEKSYNKFYSHLAARLCEFQPQCKFSLQLSFWDSFKQMNNDEMEARKAANLAKLLFHLVAVHTHCLKLYVIKPIPMATPEELSETTLIFLTLFLSAILDYYDDTSHMGHLITEAASKQRKSDDDDDGTLDDAVALRASLTVFLVQVMKTSPKYKKGSKFRSNLKAAIKACDVNDDEA